MQNYKTLEDSVRKSLDDLECDNNLLDKTVKIQLIKEIIDKLDFITITKFCSAKNLSR